MRGIVVEKLIFRMLGLTWYEEEVESLEKDARSFEILEEKAGP
jgi:hypothetical protein